ncbi:hypothetical protein D9M68_559070 [compost metagenome]
MSSSKVCEPSAIDCSMASLTPEKSPFSIRSATSAVFSITSSAGTRAPAGVRSRRCDTTARSAEPRSPSRVGRTSTGKKLRMRFSAR